MEMSLIAALVTAVLVLAITKVVFKFQAWLLPESDLTYRNQIDSVIDKLDRHSLFQIGRIVLIRLLRRTRRLFSIEGRSYATDRAPRLLFTSRLQAYVIFGAVAILLNTTIFVLASILTMATHFETITDTAVAMHSWVQLDEGWFRFFGMNALVSALGAGFDLFSFMITWALLNRAVKAKTALSLAGHLGADLVIAALSCMWAYAILSLTLDKYYKILLPIVFRFSHSNPNLYIKESLWSTLDVNPSIWYVVVFLGISAALPTILYIIVLAPVLALRAIPRRIQHFLSLILFRLTTDKTPVMKQLETFVGSGGALLGAIIAWLQFLPA